MASPLFAAGSYAAIQRLSNPASPASAPGGSSQGVGSFAQMVQQAVGAVAETGKAADAQTLAAASGKGDLVQVVTAVAESEAALQTLVAVRDRVISAYEDIMRMSI